MPIETPQGTLTVENAILEASSFKATTAVGIGTDNNDAYPLQIFKETAPEIRIHEGATQSSAAKLYSNNSNLYIQTGTNFTSGSSGDIAFQTMGGQSTHMIVKSDGKVGVGTPSPGEKLHVNGNMRIDNGSIKLYRPDTTGGPSLTFYNPDDSVSGWFGFGSNNRNEFRMVTNNNYPLTFYTSATGSGVERMRISHDGNVGINTVNPSYPLHVNGITRLNQYIGSRSGTFSGSATFELPGDLDYGAGVGTAPAIGWEIHLAYGFTGTNGGSFYIVGCQDTSGTNSGANESSTFTIHPGNNYGNASSTCYLCKDREVGAPGYYSKITIVQVYNNNVATATAVSRFHMMFESVGCHRGVGSTKTQGSAYFKFPSSSRRPKYLRLTCDTGSVQGNYMINALTA